jgi:hypothetical protein
MAEQDVNPLFKCRSYCDTITHTERKQAEMLYNPDWKHYLPHIHNVQVAVAPGVGDAPEMIAVYPDPAEPVKVGSAQAILQNTFARDEASWIDAENKWPSTLMWRRGGELEPCWMFGTPDEDGWQQLHIATVTGHFVIARGRHMSREDYHARF